MDWKTHKYVNSSQADPQIQCTTNQHHNTIFDYTADSKVKMEIKKAMNR